MKGDRAAMRTLKRRRKKKLRLWQVLDRDCHVPGPVQQSMHRMNVTSSGCMSPEYLGVRRLAAGQEVVLLVRLFFTLPQRSKYLGKMSRGKWFELGGRLSPTCSGEGCVQVKAAVWSWW